jgi:2-polyprenyl-3-methyl-5-hydroxy-6-metoxy-1,4-benzoquinol methylase
MWKRLAGIITSAHAIILIKVFGAEPMTRIVNELSSRFGAPPEFIRHYLDTQHVDLTAHVSADAWLSSLSELNRFYVEYGLSTNQRAVATVDLVLSRHSGPARRHLDVGSGQGGLVRTFASRGIKSVGVEILPELYNLSRENIRGVDAEIILGSILELDHLSLGQFDIITCTEVIEHVKNPELLIHRIADLLAPGGTLFLRMPNGRQVDAVRSDGHFLQFGITLLTREEAKAYKNYITGQIDEYELMGEYYPKEYYTALLERHGFSHELIAPTDINSALVRFPEQASQLMAAHVAWRTKEATQVPFFQRQRVETALACYLADAFAAYSAAIAGRNAREFVIDYCVDFWPFLAKKS